MLRILTTNFNTTPYIHKLINSLKSQTVDNWHCVIMDDLSTDGSVPYIKFLIEDDDRFELVVNEKKLYQPGNYWNILQREDIDDDDICITVDGDDFLPDNQVLKRVLLYYCNDDIWMTFGNFKYYDGLTNDRVGFVKRPEPFDDARKLGWCSSHLRTWKCGLFRKIKHEDLIDERTGNYFSSAGDVAIWSPMLEMCGSDRVLYTKDINYMYNIETDLNDFKLVGSEQQEITRIIANKPKYNRMDSW